VAVSPDAQSAAKTTSDYVALAVATCGVGYMPVAPGTFGSMVGLLLYVLLRLGFVRFLQSNSAAVLSTRGTVALFLAAQLVTVALISVVGIWAGTRTERLLGRKDPGAVVIDEVAGQLLTLAFLPLFAAPWLLIMGFGLFRLFDIVKPYPARRAEALPSGRGIMADDLVAGAYAGMVLAAILVGQSLVR
jgi:phosphatidylglycerophosphatase A